MKIIVIALLFCWSSLMAEEATVLELKGQAKVIRLASFGVKALSQGMALEKGDIVKTGKNTLVHIELKSGRVALIKSDSVFKILSSGKGKHQILDFAKGEFLVGTLGKIKKDETFIVRTPALVAGVRGTLFWGLADDELNSTFACFESQIVLQAQGAELLLNPNEKVFVAYGEKPKDKEAANIPLSYLDTFKVDGYLQGLDDLLK